MTQAFIKNHAHWLLVGILILAAGLIFFNLAGADVQTDEAIYAFRSVGYLDYMSSNFQTAPIDWFSEIPWWSKLSFHDAPPLVFFIQHLFFIIFGVSVFVLRLPFALAGVGAVFLTYLIGKKLYNQTVGLLAALTLTIFSYHVWASRVGYLEVVALLFILTTIYFFLRSLEDNKWWPLFGIILGLTLLTKYTVLFAVLALMLYVVIAQRSILKNKRFWLALMIALVIFSPVIFYNFKIYQARGHFDVQFAKLLGQDISKDWPVLGQSSFSLNPLQNGIQIIKTLATSFSITFFVAILVASVYALATLRKRQYINLLPILMLICGIVQFMFIPPAARFLSLFNPFFALFLAWAAFDIWTKTTQYRIFNGIFFIGLIIFSFFELTYNVNTNLLAQAYGQPGVNYSSNRLEAAGFNELEKYLGDELDLSFKAKKIKSIEEIMISSEDFYGQDVILYDSGLRWFSTVWYFGRWTTYTDSLAIPSREIASAIQGGNLFQFFQQAGARRIYLVQGNLDSLMEVGDYRFNDQGFGSSVREVLIELGATKDIVYNNRGQEAFTVYISEVATWPDLFSESE